MCLRICSCGNLLYTLTIFVCFAISRHFPSLLVTGPVHVSSLLATFLVASRFFSSHSCHFSSLLVRSSFLMHFKLKMVARPSFSALVSSRHFSSLLVIILVLLSSLFVKVRYCARDQTGWERAGRLEPASWLEQRLTFQCYHSHTRSPRQGPTLHGAYQERSASPANQSRICCADWLVIRSLMDGVELDTCWARVPQM